MTDGCGKSLWISSPVRACVERLLVRWVRGLRKRGESGVSLMGVTPTRTVPRFTEAAELVDQRSASIVPIVTLDGPDRGLVSPMVEE